KPGRKYWKASRWSSPSAITAPNTAENVCRGTPSQSAHVPYSRLSSTSVSPTSKTTALITRASYGGSGQDLEEATVGRVQSPCLAVGEVPDDDLSRRDLGVAALLDAAGRVGVLKGHERAVRGADRARDLRRPGARREGPRVLVVGGSCPGRPQDGRRAVLGA